MSIEHPAYEQLRQVTPTAAVLLAHNPGRMTLEGTNTWIVRGPADTGYLVVDPGPKDRAHSEAIARVTGGNIALTLITHGHRDHTGGIDQLVRLTGTPVRAGDAAFVRGGAGVLTDQEVVEVAGVRVTVLHTPGHTADSLSFLLEDAVLTGDTILGRGTTVLESTGAALRDYLSSLKWLEQVGVGRTLLPAHGPDHPDTAVVARQYQQHRQERLDQVRAALAELGHDASALAVMRRVYADVDLRLWPAALSSVRAQLSYLRSHRK